MGERLVPDTVQTAARRAFLRTAAQSLANGFLVPAGLAFAFTSSFLAAAGLGLAGAVWQAVTNGAQAYFSILAKGIPEAYTGREG